MYKFPEPGFRSSGATKALRPWNPTGKVPAPGTRAGKTGTVFPPGGGALRKTGMVVQERHTAPVGAKPAFLPGMTSTAKPHGGMKGGAPEKYLQLLGKAQKSRGPWPKGGNFLGKRALPAPAAAGGHAQNLQMLTR